MELFYLEKLMEEAHIADKIAAGVVDDTAYNAVTQTINEGVLMEAEYEAEKVLSTGKDLNGEVNLSELALEVNSALGINENADDINSNKPSEDETMKKQVQMEGAENPSAGVNNAAAFMNATAIKQQDFVKAKAKTVDDKDKEMATAEHEVTKNPTDDNVEKQAEKTMDAMRKGADGNKKWQDVAKTVTENAGKFVSFVESLKDEDNGELLEAVLSAFKVVVPVMESETDDQAEKRAYIKEKMGQDPSELDDKTVNEIFKFLTTGE